MNIKSELEDLLCKLQDENPNLCFKASLSFGEDWENMSVVEASRDKRPPPSSSSSEVLTSEDSGEGSSCSSPPAECPPSPARPPLDEVPRVRKRQRRSYHSSGQSSGQSSGLYSSSSTRRARPDVEVYNHD